MSERSDAMTAPTDEMVDAAQRAMWDAGMLMLHGPARSADYPDDDELIAANREVDRLNREAVRSVVAAVLAHVPSAGGPNVAQ